MRNSHSLDKIFLVQNFLGQNFLGQNFCTELCLDKNFLCRIFSVQNALGRNFPRTEIFQDTIFMESRSDNQQNVKSIRLWRVQCKVSSKSTFCVTLNLWYTLHMSLQLFFFLSDKLKTFSGEVNPRDSGLHFLRGLSVCWAEGTVFEGGKAKPVSGSQMTVRAWEGRAPSSSLRSLVQLLMCFAPSKV